MLYHYDPERGFTTVDGSHITEMLGRVTTADSGVSVARIQMPAGGGQPRRSNGFRELMLIISGSCTVDLATATLELGAGDVLDLPADTMYAERGGPAGCELWAVCWPAFNPALVTWAPPEREDTTDVRCGTGATELAERGAADRRADRRARGGRRESADLR